MKQYILCTLLLVITTCTHSFAQWGFGGNTEEIAAVKNRTMIVVIETPDQKIIDDLTKKNKSEYIDIYKKAVDDYNARMKDAVVKFWTFSQKIEYKTDDEVDSLIKSKSKDYTVLRCATTRGNPMTLTAHSGLYWKYNKSTFNQQNEGATSWRNSSILELSLIEKEDHYSPIDYIGLQDVFPVESDIIYGLRNLQAYLIMSENKEGFGQMKGMVKANAAKLKDETLVVRKDILDTNLTIEAIKTVYPYKFEIADSAEFEQHVINADNGYAVLEEIPVYGGATGATTYFAYMVMDTKSGDCMGYVTPSWGASEAATAGQHTFPNDNGLNQAHNAASLNNSIGSPVADKRVFKKLADQISGK